LLLDDRVELLNQGLVFLQLLFILVCFVGSKFATHVETLVLDLLHSDIEVERGDFIVFFFIVFEHALQVGLELPDAFLLGKVSHLQIQELLLIRLSFVLGHE